MFNLQGSELIIILLLALVVLGPEKLPDAMRKAGRFYADMKKMSTGFQEEFRAAVDEPMREMRETANALRDSADFTKLQTGGRDEKPKSAEMSAVAPLEPPSGGPVMPPTMLQPFNANQVASSSVPFAPPSEAQASAPSTVLREAPTLDPHPGDALVADPDDTPPDQVGAGGTEHTA